MIYVIVAKDYYYNGSDYDMSRKADYADKLDTVFSRAGVQSLINNGTIIGVELGNEEAVSTWDNFQTGYWFGTNTGGQRYAEFYLEAYNQLKNDTLSDALFRKLDILASASNPESHGIAYDDLDTNPRTGFGSSGEFFAGFIDKVITLGGRDKLPDIAAVHQYTLDSGTYSPEFREYNLGEFDQRTDGLTGSNKFSIFAMPRVTFPISRKRNMAIVQLRDSIMLQEIRVRKHKRFIIYVMH